MRSQEAVTPFSAAAAGTSADFELKGGQYLMVYAATGAGTAVLNAKSPDGSYQKVTPVEAALAAAGTQRYFCAPGIYQLVVATSTANTVVIARIPED